MQEFKSSFVPGQEYERPVYTSPVNGNWRALSVTAANLILTGGMILLRADSALETITYILYFVVSTSLFQVIDSGQLAAIIQVLSDARTQRNLHRLQYTVYRPATDPVQTPALPEPTKNFVPAAPNASVQREAAAWVAQLYDAYGVPDRRKVWPDGRIRVKMPSSEATAYLVQRHVVKPLMKGETHTGYGLHPRYSTRDDALYVLQ